MTGMQINVGDGAWPDLRDNPKIIDLMGANAPAWNLTLLPDATVRGNATITLRVDLPDGRIVLLETTARLFLQAAMCIEEVLRSHAERN